MRILHCTAQLPMKTGSGVYFSILIEGLLKNNHQNAVIYGTQKPFSKKSYSNILNTEKKIIEYPVNFLSENLIFPISGMSDIMPYQSTLYSEMTEDMYTCWIKAFKEKLLKAKAKFSPEVIIVHHIFILASLVTEIFPNSKIIAICHGTDIRQIKQNPWIKEKYIKNIEKINRFLVVSPKSVEDIISIFNIENERITIVGGGFNPVIFNDNERIRFSNKNNKNNEGNIIKLVYAGKIAPSKGVFELAKTLPIILKEYPNIELTLIGNASEEQKQELKKNADCSKNLIICNAQNQVEMSKILKKADVFILPSYYETLGLVAIEALACGLRTVTTEIEGLIALLDPKIKESGIIEFVKLPRIYDIDKPVEEDKPEFVKNLAEKIMLQIRRIKNKDDVYPLVKKEIKSHSWENIIKKIEKILNE